MMMAISKKLEVIYHNGQPDGIRSIRRNLSTMTTYVIPRPLLSEAKNISGIHRPGIYYLIHEADGKNIVQLYVGQTRNGIIAYGIYDGEKFEVLDGSQINMDKPAHLQKYNHQREQLLAQQAIVNMDGKYILNATLSFDTPSGAGQFILGGAINGWTEWKNKDGKTLDELYRK